MLKERKRRLLFLYGGTRKVAEADYNLSVSTYVEKEDTREKIDIDVLNKEIAETVAKIDHLRME